MRLDLNTVLDLAKNYLGIDKPNVLEVPFYSPIYNKTFGLQDSIYTKELSDYLRTLPKGSNVIEAFSGNGFESYLQAKELRQHNFYCLDLLDYPNKYNEPNLKHLLWNVLDMERLKSKIDKIDCVFVGPTNASLVELDNPTATEFIKKSFEVLPKGGLLILSFSLPNESKGVSFHKEELDSGNIWATIDFKDYDADYTYNMLVEEETLTITEMYKTNLHSRASMLGALKDFNFNILNDEPRFFILRKN